jgi:hypothetical protein
VLGKSEGMVLGSDNRDVLETQGITTAGGLALKGMHSASYRPLGRFGPHWRLTGGSDRCDFR